MRFYIPKGAFNAATIDLRPRYVRICCCLGRSGVVPMSLLGFLALAVFADVLSAGVVVLSKIWLVWVCAAALQIRHSSGDLVHS